MNKSNILIILLFATNIICNAQSFAGESQTVMLYKDFQSALIELSNGSVIKEKYANIFLKNGKLLYKNTNNVTMQADMRNIKSVKFVDREYIRIDTLLAYVVDTVESNRLLCATLIDIDSYNAKLTNSQLLTKLDLSSSYVNTISLENTLNEEDKSYPLINYFFFEIENNIINVHERDIKKILPKDKQRIFKTIINTPQFDFGKIECLKHMLRTLW